MLYSALTLPLLATAFTVQNETTKTLKFSDKPAWKPHYEDFELTDKTITGSRVEGGVVWWELQYAKRPEGNPLGNSVLSNDIPETGNSWSEPVICPQPRKENDSRKMRKDCLVLSIYQPDQHVDNSGAEAPLLPVIVLFHPGANLMGDHSFWGIQNGMELAKAQDAIVVTINYRLGLDGFLMDASTSSSLSGHNGNDMNATMSDQRNALIWIRSHIKDFNGNPDMITAAGSSAGASNIMAHMISSERCVAAPAGNAAAFTQECHEMGFRFDSAACPGACDKALFDKAWMMSGIDTEHMFMKEESASTYYRMMGMKRGCYSEDHESTLSKGESFMECMAMHFEDDYLEEDPRCDNQDNSVECWSMDTVENHFGLTAHENLSTIRHVVPFAFAVGPNMFLKHMPQEAIEMGEWWKVPTVFGMLQNEESIFREAMQDEVTSYWNKAQAAESNHASGNWNMVQKLLRYAFTHESLESQDGNGSSLEERVITQYLHDSVNDEAKAADLVMRDALFYCTKFDIINAIAAEGAVETRHYTIEEQFGSNGEIGSFHFADYLMMLQAYEHNSVTQSYWTQIWQKMTMLMTQSFVDQWKLALEFLLHEMHAESIEDLELNEQMVPIGNLLRQELSAFSTSSAMTMGVSTDGNLVQNVFTKATDTAAAQWTARQHDQENVAKLIERCTLLTQLKVPYIGSQPASVATTVATTTAAATDAATTTVATDSEEDSD